MLRSNIKYWYFKSVIPDYICNQIIKLGNSLKEDKGHVGEPENDGTKLKVRDTNVSWISHKWVLKEIIPYIGIANINAKWFVEMDNHELAQFTKYKLNQHYGWHCDSWNEPYAMDKENVNIRGKIRKLSMTICLSDEKDYKGGEFEFQPRFEEDPNYIVECKEVRQKGSIVVFPSFIWHRVKAVTEGTRYSLVVWNLGKPFV